MVIDELIILTLLKLPGFGNKTVKKLLDNLNYKLYSYQDIYDYLVTVNTKNSHTLELISKTYDDAQNIIEKSLNYGIKIQSLFNLEGYYPSLLRSIPDAPLLLYCKGNLEVLNKEKMIAVIGTREPTEYGVKIGKRLTEVLVSRDYVIVSGLALGCDSIAHQTCLDANGKTVAVLAGGLDKIYPKQNQNMAFDIVENGGCLISEYEVEKRPFKTSFVERDRIQSGLCRAIFVIETGIIGGTLHTVSYAKKQDRKIACINSHPESFINHEKIQGNLMLVKEGKAVGIKTSEDLNKFLESTYFKDIYISDNINLNIKKNNQIELFN